MKSKILAVTLALCMLVTMVGPAMAAPAEITDVSGNWASEQITKWVNQGLIKGYEDGTFKPDNAVTRAEFVTMLNRVFALENADAVADFADVEATDWFYQDVAAAKAAGYLAGYEDGTFKPNNPMTRQEVAKVVAQYLKLAPVTTEVTFTDVDAIGDWAEASVKSLVAAKLISGYPDGTFKPGNSITRAEAVVMLDRAKTYTPSAPVEAEKISGTVTLDGEAVANAEVFLFDENDVEVAKKTSTNAYGEFEIRVAAGYYDLTAVKDGYLGYASSVAVAADAGTETEITLTKGVNVTGRLIDQTGDTVGNTSVAFTTNPTFITRTDSTGYFSLYLLPERNYAARAYIPGKESQGMKLVASDISVGAGDKALGSMRAGFTVGTGSSGSGSGGSGRPPVSGDDNAIKEIKLVDDPAGNTVVKVFIKDAFASIVTGVTVNGKAANKNPATNEYRITLDGALTIADLTIVVQKSGVVPGLDEAIEEIKLVDDPAGNTVVKVFIKDAFASIVTGVTVNGKAANKNPATNEYRITLDGALTIADLTVVVQKSGVAPVNKAALNAAISTANGKAAAAQVGDAPGNYPQTALDAFNTAITTAQVVADNVDATQSQVDAALAALNTATATFEAKKIPVDGDAAIKDTYALIDFFGVANFSVVLQSGVTASAASVDGQAMLQDRTDKYMLKLAEHTYKAGDEVTFTVVIDGTSVTKTAIIVTA